MDDTQLPEGTPAGDSLNLDVLAQVTADYLYRRTADSKVSGQKNLVRLPPSPQEQQAMAVLLAAVGTEGVHPALTHIAMTQGKKDRYFFDARIMTRQYAAIDALLEDKDILATIATTTRSDSKLYPRPTQFSKLMSTPFRFTQDEILGAVARMQHEEQYKDIGVVTASNGNSAFFSDRHLSRRYAQALVQQIEVEEGKNP